MKKNPNALYDAFNETKKIGEGIKSYIFDAVIKMESIISINDLMEMPSMDITKFIKQYNEVYNEKNGISEFSK